MKQLVDGLGGSQLAMPVEIVQFCWKYNAERLKNLPEVAGCEVSSLFSVSGAFLCRLRMQSLFYWQNLFLCIIF
jgi:hypothetical protein